MKVNNIDDRLTRTCCYCHLPIHYHSLEGLRAAEMRGEFIHVSCRKRAIEVKSSVLKENWK